MKIGFLLGGYGLALAALAVFAAFFVAVPAVQADTLHATDDAYVNFHPNSEKKRFGGSGSLFVAPGSQTRYSFLRFDLSGLPAGAAIEQARLRLFVTSVPAAGAVERVHLRRRRRPGHGRCGEHGRGAALSHRGSVRGAALWGR